MNLRKISQSIMKLITPENIGKAFDTFNKGVDFFNKSVKEFGDSMGKMNKEFSEDIVKSNKRSKSQENKNKQNLEKLFGPKKSIWSDKKSKESLF